MKRAITFEQSEMLAERSSQKLAAETQARIDGDSALIDALAAEAQTRKEADDSLSQSLAAETEERKAADTSNEEALATETAARTEAEGTLQDKIRAEQKAREEGDSGLTTKLGAETTAREAADDAINEALEAETSAREESDSRLSQALATETSERKSEDTAIRSDFSAETIARTEADTALWARIDSEATAREEAVEATQAAAEAYADAKAAATDAALKAHKDNTSNPHSVTKAQVGLGNVDNTADKDKPVSTKQQAAITAAQEAAEAYADSKAEEVSSALTDHINDTGNPHKVTAAQTEAVPVAEKGAKLGVAPLDAGGKIDPKYLPSFVSDVLEFPTMDDFPPTGEQGKIYIDDSTDREYRWTGAKYREVSKNTDTTYELSKSGSTITLTGSDGSKTTVTDADTVYTHPGHTAHDNGFYKVTVDSTGHVSETKAVTKEDITGLDIPGQDTVYTHPTHTPHPNGLYKVTVDGEGHVTEAAEVVKDDIVGLGIPGTDTTYKDATQAEHGLMTAADKAKLDGIAEGATNVTVDSALSAESANPVENKAVAAKFPIKTDDIGDGAVTQDKLAAKSVGNEQMQLGSISNGKIQDKTITGGKLADKTVTGDKIAERTVGLSNLAPGSESNTVMVTVYENNQYETHWRKIDSSMIMDKQVQNADIADGTIVGSEKLKAKSVTGGRIADKTVGTEQLADKCINADKMQAGSVTQPKIQDKAVTKGKLDDEVANQLHTHGNKAVLDGIDAAEVAEWNKGAQSLAIVRNSVSTNVPYLNTENFTVKFDGPAKTVTIEKKATAKDNNFVFTITDTGEKTIFNHLDLSTITGKIKTGFTDLFSTSGTGKQGDPFVITAVKPFALGFTVANTEQYHGNAITITANAIEEKSGYLEQIGAVHTAFFCGPVESGEYVWAGPWVEQSRVVDKAAQLGTARNVNDTPFDGTKDIRLKNTWNYRIPTGSSSTANRYISFDCTGSGKAKATVLLTENDRVFLVLLSPSGSKIFKIVDTGNGTGTFQTYRDDLIFFQSGYSAPEVYFTVLGNTYTALDFASHTGKPTPTENVTIQSLAELPIGTEDIEDKAVTEMKLDDKVANQLHTHENQTALDTITQEKVTSWDNAGSEIRYAASMTCEANLENYPATIDLDGQAFVSTTVPSYLDVSALDEVIVKIASTPESAPVFSTVVGDNIIFYNPTGVSGKVQYRVFKLGSARPMNLS